MNVPMIIENCASCRCGVDCTGDQHYCNHCERTLCEDAAACHMITDDCPLIPTDEVWCTVCATKSIEAAAQLMRDVRALAVRVA